MRKRMEGLDIARALAILGMMFVNYALVFQVEPTSLIAHFFIGLEGRAAAVFMIVAGIGIGVLSQKGTGKALYSQLCKRSLFLWALGLVLYTTFQWTADILHYYGLFMLLIIPFLKAHKGVIEGGILLVLLLSTYLQLSQNYLTGWDFATLRYTDFWSLAGFMRNLLFNGFHPLFPWFAFMLIGLWLSKVDLSQTTVQKKLMAAGIGIALSFEVVSVILKAYLGHGHWLLELVQTKPMPPNLLYMGAATGWAIAFIGFCLWFAETLVSNRQLITPLVYTGQMSLSHYVFHSAVVLSIMDALKLIEAQSANFVLYLTLGVYAIMLITSVLWRRRFSRGPLELVMRRLSDGGNNIA